MVINRLPGIESMPDKKVVQEHEYGGIKEISGPGAGQAGPEIGKGIVAVSGFIVEIPGYKKEEGQMEQIYKRAGKIAAVP